MKVTVDQYEAIYKHRVIQIFRYPNIQDCWLYDDHPAEETYDCSGTIAAMKIFASCFALSIFHPEAIIGLPVKKNDGVAGTTFNMVLTRPCLDGFRPSVWYKMKHTLKQSRKYIFNYDEQALIDYASEVLEPSYNDVKRGQDNQRELGDTIFCQYSEHDLYEFHSGIYQACDSLTRYEERTSECWGLGWVYSDNLMDQINERRERKDDSWND